MKKLKSFCVIGLGTFGSAITKALVNLKKEVMVIDTDESRVENFADLVSQAIIMDATDEKELKKIGIKDIDVVFVCVGPNVGSSTLITLLLKEMGVKNVIVKAVDDLHAKVLMKIGADRIVQPEKEFAERLARSLTTSNLLDYMELSEMYSLAEIVVPPIFYNKSLQELNLRVKYGVYVMAIKRKTPKVKESGTVDIEEEIKVLPGADDVFLEGDIMVVVGNKESIEKIASLK